MATVFDTIITQGVRAGQIPSRTNSAREWFRDTAGKMNRINEREMMKGDTARMTTQPLLGSMYMFYYDPKHKEELPYYDRFPLIFIFAPSLIPAGTLVVIFVGVEPFGESRKFNSVPYIDSLNPIDASVCKSAPWR